MPTNNITRLLDSRDINYTAYKLPTHVRSAADTAQFLEAPLSLIYKSIVVERKGRGKLILAVVPGDREVNTRALALAAGAKKVTLTTRKKAEKETGLQAGGISPLALINKGFDIYLDAESKKHPEIHISGGELGLNIRLPVKDLIFLTGAELAPISQPISDRF